jgi:hypothetical protein
VVFVGTPSAATWTARALRHAGAAPGSQGRAVAARCLGGCAVTATSCWPCLCAYDHGQRLRHVGGRSHSLARAVPSRRCRQRCTGHAGCRPCAWAWTGNSGSWVVGTVTAARRGYSHDRHSRHARPLPAGRVLGSRRAGQRTQPPRSWTAAPACTCTKVRWATLTGSPCPAVSVRSAAAGAIQHLSVLWSLGLSARHPRLCSHWQRRLACDHQSSDGRLLQRLRRGDPRRGEGKRVMDAAHGENTA